MKRALGLIATLLPATASSATFGIHVGSRHDSTGFNDDNQGIYFSFNDGLTVGTVLNSVSRQSVYAGMTFNRVLAPYVEVSATVGGITGYDMPVTPMVIPSVSYSIDRVRWRCAYLPKIHQAGANAIHFMIEKDF